LTLAAEMPEHNKDPGDESVDHKVQQKSARAKASGDCIHYLRHAQTKYEVKTRVAHGEHGVDHGKNRDGDEPSRAAFHHSLGAKPLRHGICDG
jgi:hypothetical protein